MGALALLLLSTIFAAGVASALEPPSERAKYFVQYAPNLYEACAKAKLELTLRAIQALDRVHHYSNPLLPITLLALDDDAWRDLARAMRPGTPVGRMLSDATLVTQVMQAHQVDFPFFTNYWPPQGGRAVDTLLPGRAIELRAMRNASGAPAFAVLGYQNAGGLVASAPDLRAGASVLHVLSIRQQEAGNKGAGSGNATGVAGQL